MDSLELVKQSHVLFNAAKLQLYIKNGKEQIPKHPRNILKGPFFVKENGVSHVFEELGNPEHYYLDPRLPKHSLQLL